MWMVKPRVITKDELNVPASFPLASTCLFPPLAVASDITLRLVGRLGKAEMVADITSLASRVHL